MYFDQITALNVTPYSGDSSEGRGSNVLCVNATTLHTVCLSSAQVAGMAIPVVRPRRLNVWIIGSNPTMHTCVLAVLLTLPKALVN